MDLWTWQHPEWCIDSQPRDLSHLSDDWPENIASRLPSLYERLHSMLGTCQFIFCFTHEQDPQS